MTMRIDLSDGASVDIPTFAEWQAGIEPDSPFESGDACTLDNPMIGLAHDERTRRAQKGKAMRVTVRDRKTEAEYWGYGPSSVILRTVEIADTCPVCGGPRGKPYARTYHEDGEWYRVDRWDNPCGHIDSYASVLDEAHAHA